MENSIKDILPDFPLGPLTPYRKKASFHWRNMVLAIDSEYLIRYKHNIWSLLEKHDVIYQQMETPSLDEQRRISQKRVRLISSKMHLKFDQFYKTPEVHAAWVEAVHLYDISAATSFGISHRLFAQVLRFLGTSRHEKYAEAAENDELVGCFGLTELAHGSNTKGIRTTATFDSTTREFIVDTPDFKAAKFWAGLLGKRATHVIVYANLIVKGKNEGLHAFIVPIRCTHSLKAFSGITVGDLGEKMGMNGLDNGFLLLHKYRIPVENLLNRHSDINENGDFVSMIENPNIRFLQSLSILSMGRVGVTGSCTTGLQKAIIIAIRYLAVRRQFGPSHSQEEYPVIEYQQMQCRLMPYLAATFALKIFSNWFLCILAVNVTSRDLNCDFEIHGISAATKPGLTWCVRDGLQVCREACGGNGNLHGASFGTLRNDHDLCCTYEGDNHILLQLASNWLLNIFRDVKNGKVINTPYKTTNFLNDYIEIAAQKSEELTKENILDVEIVMRTYRWLICHNLTLTSEKERFLQKEGKDKFTIRNETRKFYGDCVGMLFSEYIILETFYKFILNVEDQSSKDVFLKLASLYGLWNLEKHLGTLYMNRYYSRNEGIVMRDAIIDVCRVITPEAVALVDAISPPDYILNSILGNSDGMIYENIQSALFSNPEVMTRPSWWTEIISSPEIPSKL